MGIMDGLLGRSADSSANAKGIPFTLSTSFRPLRLSAHSSGSVDLLLTLTNTSGSPQICSLVIELPRTLGFDGVGLHKTKELRIGSLAANEKKELSVGIVGSNQTTPGVYRIRMIANAHYRDYAHVLNSASKTIELRVV